MSQAWRPRGAVYTRLACRRARLSRCSVKLDGWIHGWTDGWTKMDGPWMDLGSWVGLGWTLDGRMDRLTRDRRTDAWTDG
eukprot:364240-Chlamydomonas_euryale.AAC.7